MVFGGAKEKGDDFAVEVAEAQPQGVEPRQRQRLGGPGGGKWSIGVLWWSGEEIDLRGGGGGFFDLEVSGATVVKYHGRIPVGIRSRFCGGLGGSRKRKARNYPGRAEQRWEKDRRSER